MGSREMAPVSPDAVQPWRRSGESGLGVGHSGAGEDGTDLDGRLWNMCYATCENRRPEGSAV